MLHGRKILIVALVAAASLALSPTADALSVLGCEISLGGVVCPF